MFKDVLSTLKEMNPLREMGNQRLHEVSELLVPEKGVNPDILHALIHNIPHQSIDETRLLVKQSRSCGDFGFLLDTMPETDQGFNVFPNFFDAFPLRSSPNDDTGTVGAYPLHNPLQPLPFLA